MKNPAVNSSSGSAPPQKRDDGRFEHFHPQLYHYLLRRLKNTEDAEDLAQEIYLRLLRATDLNQIKRPQAYVYRIAFNVIYEFRLRKFSAPVVFDSPLTEEIAEQLTEENDVPEVAAESEARADLLASTVKRLPLMQRTVLRLATHQGLAHVQIAERLGISVSTVRNHLYKAIDHCRHHLAGAT